MRKKEKETHIFTQEYPTTKGRGDVSVRLEIDFKVGIYFVLSLGHQTTDFPINGGTDDTVQNLALMDAIKEAVLFADHALKCHKDEQANAQAPTEEKYIYFTAVYIGTNSNQGFVTGTCYKIRMLKFGGMEVVRDNYPAYNYTYASISAFLHDWKDISALTEDKDRY